MKSFQVIISILLLIPIAAGAIEDPSNGVVKGTVTEQTAESAVPVPFANVYLLGTQTGTSTDFDGNFEFKATPGQYKLVVSSIGIKPDTIDLIVKAGETVTMNVEVGTNSQMLDAIVITEEADRSNDNILLMMQKDASVMEQSIGSNELASKGASNVEQGVTKISGIAKSEASNDLFVRGLGDRYNNASLNGLPVPSGNPDKKVIDLSVFPSGIVESIGVSKTMNPDAYADFVGATININTVDRAQKTFLNGGVNISGNSITTFKEFYGSSSQSVENKLGYGYSDRQLPSELTQDATPYTSPSDAKTSPFTGSWNNEKFNAGPSVGYSINGGTSKQVGSMGELSGIVSAQHNNGYQFREGLDQNLDNTGAPINSYKTQRYSYTTQTSTLAGLNYKINPNHHLKFNSLYLHNSSDVVSVYNTTILERDRDTYTYSNRNTLRINTMLLNQLTGEHQLYDNKLIIAWGAGLSSATEQEPDRRQILLSDQNREQDNLNFERQNVNDNHRWFSELNERELSSRGELKYQFKKSAVDEKVLGALMVGVQTKMKKREYAFRQFDIQLDSLHNHIADNNESVDPFNADTYLNNEAVSSGQIKYIELRDPSKTHFATQNVFATYAMVDYDLTTRLKVVGGFRIEMSHQEIQYKTLASLLQGPYNYQTYDTINVLPSIASRYQLSEKSNLRFAASQTVSRPNLREMAPFQYQDQSRKLFEGNPYLVNAYAYNADLKYERFPNTGELLAVTLYAKYIDNPIEIYQVPSSGALFTYLNVGHAYVGGIEFEFKKSLGNIISTEDFDGTRVVDRINVGFSGAYNYTKLNIGDDINSPKGTILATNKTRPMFGASPYLVMSDLGYKFQMGSVSSIWSVVYNVFGPRVAVAGIQGGGDIYEMPVHALDFVAQNTISKRIDLNLKVRNILNPTITQRVVAPNQDAIFNQYKRGMDVSLGLQYRFIK
ncbi:MAG: TonB-dependent receptor [Flavobacteriales bacterium]